ncbi:MAG: FMN-binding protein [bacterium]|nr:FMN-binding protein [bacterium]
MEPGARVGLLNPRGLLLALGLWVALGAPAFGQVFEDPDAALQSALRSGEQLTPVSWSGLSAEVAAALKAQSGQALRRSWTRCHQAQSASQPTAYLCIDNMIGKTEPITYLARIAHPSGRLEDLRLLIYRESVGAEIRHPLFLAQFLGKDTQAPLGLSQDIQAISGATYSSRAVAQGSRKLLWLYRLYLSKLSTEQP